MNKTMSSVGLSAALMVGVTGCAEQAATPEAGVITSIKNDSFQQYKSEYGCEYDYDAFSGKFKTVCKDRSKPAGKIAIKVVTISACKKEAGKLVLASKEYLNESANYPTDYPVTGVGETEDNVKCGTTLEVAVDKLGALGIGSVVTVDQLSSMQPVRDI